MESHVRRIMWYTLFSLQNCSTSKSWFHLSKDLFTERSDLVDLECNQWFASCCKQAVFPFLKAFLDCRPCQCYTDLIESVLDLARCEVVFLFCHDAP